MQYGSASGIKSIQRGTLSATIRDSGTLTVSSVNTSKSVLTVNNASGGLWTSSFLETGIVGGMTLSNSTTLSWKGGAASGVETGRSETTLYWELVEYN